MPGTGEIKKLVQDSTARASVETASVIVYKSNKCPSVSISKWNADQSKSFG